MPPNISILSKLTAGLGEYQALHALHELARTLRQTQPIRPGIDTPYLTIDKSGSGFVTSDIHGVVEGYEPTLDIKAIGIGYRLLHWDDLGANIKTWRRTLPSGPVYLGQQYDQVVLGHYSETIPFSRDKMYLPDDFATAGHVGLGISAGARAYIRLRGEESVGTQRFFLRASSGSELTVAHGTVDDPHDSSLVSLIKYVPGIAAGISMFRLSHGNSDGFMTFHPETSGGVSRWLQLHDGASGGGFTLVVGGMTPVSGYDLQVGGGSQVQELIKSSALASSGRTYTKRFQDATQAWEIVNSLPGTWTQGGGTALLFFDATNARAVLGLGADGVTYVRGALDLNGNVDANNFDLLELDEAGFNDALADATLAGRLRRNGANLTWHDGTVATNLLRASLATAKGDLLVATASNAITRLAVGVTNGHVLTVDSLEPTGMKWAAQSIAGAALTKTDDTNVTLTLGGSPATALVNAASLTLGWTGRLAYSRFTQATATSRLLGRVTAGAGDWEELTGTQATSLLDVFTATAKGLAPASGGGTTNFLRADGTWAPPSISGAALTKTDDTNVTLTLGGSPTTALVNAASLTLGWTGRLAFARMPQLSATSLLGVAGGLAADMAEIAATADDTIMRRTAGTLSWGQLTLGMAPDDLWTYAKLQNVSATSRLLGRITAGAGDIEELTGTQATTLLDTFTSALKGLAPASGGGTTNFLRADGTWAAPPDSGLGLTTKGDLHGYDTGQARVPVGADGTALFADSANAQGLSYAGTWRLIETITASNSATVDFTTGISSTYKAYAVVISKLVPAVNATSIWMRIGTGSPVTWQGGATAYSWVWCYAAVTFGVNIVQSTGSSIIELNDSLGNAAGRSACYVVTVFDPANTTEFCTISWLGGLIRSTGETISVRGLGHYRTAAAVTGLRFFMSSGNITSGTFKLYGLS